MSSAAVKRTSTGKLSISPLVPRRTPAPGSAPRRRPPAGWRTPSRRSARAGAGEDAVALVDVLDRPAARDQPWPAAGSATAAAGRAGTARRTRRCSSRMSSRNSCHRGRGGDGLVACGCCDFVSAQPVCGTQKNSKWSLPSTCSSRSASTLVDAHRLLDGVQVEGRHALQRDGRDDAERAQPDARGLEHLGLLVGRALDDRAVAGDEPHARRSGSAMPPSCAPVPCVAVEIAPAIDWYAMSPRFGIARPRAVAARR